MANKVTITASAHIIDTKQAMLGVLGNPCLSGEALRKESRDTRDVSMVILELMRHAVPINPVGAAEGRGNSRGRKVAIYSNG